MELRSQHRGIVRIRMTRNEETKIISQNKNAIFTSGILEIHDFYHNNYLFVRYIAQELIAINDIIAVLKQIYAAVFPLGQVPWRGGQRSHDLLLGVGGR